MDLRSIHPDVLHRWAEEVLYLHSLWHHNPPENRNPNPASGRSLRPEASATFKRKEKKRKKKNVVKPPLFGDPPPTAAGADEVEWPAVHAADYKPPTATWNDLAPPPMPPALLPVSAEEQIRLDAAKAQRNGLKASEDFFSKENGSDEDSEGDDHMDDCDEGKNAHLDFFLQLFEKDADLREYYEKNYERGRFSCLVCAGTDVKKWKRYGNGVALVQHANSVSKRIPEHQALAKVVCRLLCWDIDRLPVIMRTTKEERVRKEGDIDEKEDKVNRADLVTKLSDVDKLQWPSALSRNSNPSASAQSDLTPPLVAVTQHLASADEQAHDVTAQQKGLTVAQISSSECIDVDDNVDKHAISLMQESLYEEGHAIEKENNEDQMEAMVTKEVIEVSNTNEVERTSVLITNTKTTSSHVLQSETSAAFKKKTNERNKDVVVKSLCSENFPCFHDPTPTSMGADQFEWPTAPAADSKSPPSTWNDLAPPSVPPMHLPVTLEDQAHMEEQTMEELGHSSSNSAMAEEE